MEAEKLYEGPELDITYHVHDTLFVFWVAIFYLPILPLGILAASCAYASNIMFLKYKLLLVHKTPPNIDHKLSKFIVLWVPWMIYFASAMQLLYVRQAIYYLEYVRAKDIPIRMEDTETLKMLSLWFFFIISAYMVLPLRRILIGC